MSLVKKIISITSLYYQELSSIWTSALKMCIETPLLKMSIFFLTTRLGEVDPSKLQTKVNSKYLNLYQETLKHTLIGLHRNNKRTETGKTIVQLK
jgi:hypothetical protein